MSVMYSGQYIESEALENWRNRLPIHVTVLWEGNFDDKNFIHYFSCHNFIPCDDLIRSTYSCILY